jgi:hypothetical protein
MPKKPIVNTLTAGHTSATHLNQIFEDILDSLDNTVSRDGSTPNSMSADLDMDSNDILNAGNTHTNRLYVGGTEVTDATFVPNWEGSWTTSTSYVLNDTVKQDGNVYICLVAHTSGTFATDLTANYWELFASKGSAGDGSGDMIAANNLSDVADATTSRANLGLGNVSVENTVPVSKGGTGASTASTARTNLGLGNIATTDLIDEDNMVSDTASQAPTQQSVKAYVDSQLASHIWQEISRTTLAGESSLDITWAADTYKEIRLKLINVQPSAAATRISVRARRDTTWLSGASDYKWLLEGYVETLTTATYGSADNSIALHHPTYSPGEAVEEGLDSIVTLVEPDLNAESTVSFHSLVREDASGRKASWKGGGWVYGTTSDKITGLRIFPSTGNLASGYIIAEGLTY